jgi:hypothetical protein
MDVIVKKNSRPLLKIKLQPSNLEPVTFLTELSSRNSNISLHNDKRYDLYARHCETACQYDIMKQRDKYWKV